MEEIAFLLSTILIELPIAAWLLRRADWKHVLVIVVCVNMITHPIAWQLLMHGANWYVLEAGVAATEMLIFARAFPAVRRRAVLAALTINITSAAIGWIA